MNDRLNKFAEALGIVKAFVYNNYNSEITYNISSGSDEIIDAVYDISKDIGKEFMQTFDKYFIKYYETEVNSEEYSEDRYINVLSIHDKNHVEYTKQQKIKQPKFTPMKMPGNIKLPSTLR